MEPILTDSRGNPLIDEGRLPQARVYTLKELTAFTASMEAGAA